VGEQHTDNSSKTASKTHTKPLDPLGLWATAAAAADVGQQHIGNSSKLPSKTRTKPLDPLASGKQQHLRHIHHKHIYTSGRQVGQAGGPQNPGQPAARPKTLGSQQPEAQKPGQPAA
jgi:hypothetical protein